MRGCMLDSKIESATSGERNFIERINASIFLETVLVIKQCKNPKQI